MKKYVICLVGIALILFILYIFINGYSYNRDYECVGKLSENNTVLNKQQKIFISFNIFPYRISKDKGFGSIDYISEDTGSVKSTSFGGVNLYSDLNLIEMYESFDYKKGNFSGYMGLLKERSGMIVVYFNNYEFEGVCKKTPI